MALPVLPEQGILLHIGPHKTGTTAIQGALAVARRQLSAQGILYPGTRLEHNQPAAAAIQRSLGWERQKLDRTLWTQLAAEVRASRSRVVLSSEVFCEASGDAARQIVAELDPARVQVVVTLRPLEELLPSSWQQYVKSGYRVRYDRWLASVLASRGARTVSPSFWSRNGHPALIQRWSDCVGPKNVIVVLVDSRNRRSLFDAFEGLLRLPAGMLASDRRGPPRTGR